MFFKYKKVFFCVQNHHFYVQFGFFHTFQVRFSLCTKFSFFCTQNFFCVQNELFVYKIDFLCTNKIKPIFPTLDSKSIDTFSCLIQIPHKYQSTNMSHISLEVLDLDCGLRELQFR